MTILHSAIEHADCHEPRHITPSALSDAGKVITPSASVVGTSELRFLTFAEIASGLAPDNVFAVVDDADATKKAMFECSGITTATTRTFTFPDANGTLVIAAGTQTLTNKRVTPRVSAVAYAANIGVNSDSFDNLTCASLTGNVTVDNPTGTPTQGQSLVVRLTQDGAGARTVTWGAQFSVITAISATASLTTIWTFMWNGTQWEQASATAGV